MATFRSKFIDDKKHINLADCRDYIEEFHPDDMPWFYCLCTEPDKDGNLLPFLKIKQVFYNKYFPDLKALSARLRTLADWRITPEQMEAGKAAAQATRDAINTAEAPTD